MDTKIKSYEIYTDSGIQVVHAVEKNAVNVILNRLGYKGHELILIEGDDYYPNMQNVYTAEKLVDIELDCTDGSEVHFEGCVDITERVVSGELFINGHGRAQLSRMPKVKKRLRRGDFAKARSTMAIIKLRQLVELCNELSLKKREEHHAAKGA